MKEGASFLKAIAPAILEGTEYQSQHFDELHNRILIAINHLSEETQQEIAELFSLMDNHVARYFLAGLWSDWDKQSTKDIQKFLLNWQTGEMEILLDAYLGIHDLVLGAWYSMPESWPSINYPDSLLS